MKQENSMIELFKRNKERRERQKREDIIKEEYKNLVRKFCPDDYKVYIKDNLSCSFINPDYLESYYNGFTIDEEVSNHVTSEKQLKEIIETMCENNRKILERSN